MNYDNVTMSGDGDDDEAEVTDYGGVSEVGDDGEAEVADYEAKNVSEYGETDNNDIGDNECRNGCIKQRDTETVRWSLCRILRQLFIRKISNTQTRQVCHLYFIKSFTVYYNR